MKLRNKIKIMVLMVAIFGCLGKKKDTEIMKKKKGKEEIIEKLFNAIKNGRIELVKELLLLVADVNAKNIDGWTALMWAIWHEKIELVEELLKAKAGVNARAEDGRTALMIASEKVQIEVVKKLLLLGAEVNAKDRCGRTALMATINKWETMFITAINKGEIEIVKELLKSGADVNATNSYGETALLMASRKMHMELVYRLIEAGADEKQINLDMLINITNEEARIINPKIKHKSIPIGLLRKYCSYISERELLIEQVEIDRIIQECLIKEKLAELVYDIVSNMSKEKDTIIIDVNLLRIIDDYVRHINRQKAIMLMGQIKGKEDSAVSIIDAHTLKNILIMTKSNKKDTIERLMELKEKWAKACCNIVELKRMKEGDILSELYKK